TPGIVEAHLQAGDAGELRQAARSAFALLGLRRSARLLVRSAPARGEVAQLIDAGLHASAVDDDLDEVDVRSERRGPFEPDEHAIEAKTRLIRSTAHLDVVQADPTPTPADAPDLHGETRTRLHARHDGRGGTTLDPPRQDQRQDAERGRDGGRDDPPPRGPGREENAHDEARQGTTFEPVRNVPRV